MCAMNHDRLNNASFHVFTHDDSRHSILTGRWKMVFNEELFSCLLNPVWLMCSSLAVSSLSNGTKCGDESVCVAHLLHISHQCCSLNDDCFTSLHCTYLCRPVAPSFASWHFWFIYLFIFLWNAPTSRLLDSTFKQSLEFRWRWRAARRWTLSAPPPLLSLSLPRRANSRPIVVRTCAWCAFSSFSS